MLFFFKNLLCSFNCLFVIVGLFLLVLFIFALLFCIGCCFTLCLCYYYVLVLLLRTCVVVTHWYCFFTLVLLLCTGAIFLFWCCYYTWCYFTLMLLLCVGAFTSDVLCQCLCNCVVFFFHYYYCTNINLHTQRLFWKSNIKNALCWAFYCVNDNKEDDLTTLEPCFVFFITIVQS